ncbi:hypothetical protein TNCV_4547211 [Trichonephila clavipes]|nr:hypothetical protein TNCV_4547211 [Trichonephila clavipes]
MQNWEKLSVVGEKCRDLHAWEEEEALCKTETGKLRVQAGRDLKRVTPVLVDGVKIAVDARSQTLVWGQAILTTPSEKYSENIMLYFSYIIRPTQKLLDKGQATMSFIRGQFSQHNDC